MRGKATNRVRCTEFEMTLPETPKVASFFAQQAKHSALGCDPSDSDGALVPFVHKPQVMSSKGVVVGAVPLAGSRSDRIGLLQSPPSPREQTKRWRMIRRERRRRARPYAPQIGEP